LIPIVITSETRNYLALVAAAGVAVVAAGVAVTAAGVSVAAAGVTVVASGVAVPVAVSVAAPPQAANAAIAKIANTFFIWKGFNCLIIPLIR
jgi:hypothetical protein